MIKFHSSGVAGTSIAEVFFPNGLGASILKTESAGQTDMYEVCLIRGKEKDSEIDLSTYVQCTEGECMELLEKIRILSPD